MNDIFISYAREDRPTAQALAEIFEHQKWSVWWDREIPLGKKFSKIIEQELSTAKVVFVLWSQHSLDSDWVKDEAQEGLNRGVLLPVLLEDVKPPYGFRQIQTANLADWDGSASHPEMQGLLREVAKVLRTDAGGEGDAFVSEQQSFFGSLVSGKRRRRRALLAGALAVVVLSLGVGGYKVWEGRRRVEEERLRVEFELARAGQRIDETGRTTPPTTTASVDASPPADASPTPTPVNAIERGLVARAFQLTMQGLDKASDGDFDAAIRLYGEAIDTKEDYVDAYFNRALAHIGAGNRERAKADFARVASLPADDATRRKASHFLQKLNAPAVLTRQIVPPQDDARRSQLVNEMFANDKATRVAATTTLIFEAKADASVVRQSVAKASENLGNKAGVINTLVYLASVQPEVLQANRAEIETFLAQATERSPGPMTNQNIQKVRAVMR